MTHTDYVTKAELKAELKLFKEEFKHELSQELGQELRQEIRTEFNSCLNAIVERIDMKMDQKIKEYKAETDVRMATFEADSERRLREFRESWDKHWGVHQVIDQRISKLEWGSTATV